LFGSKNTYNISAIECVYQTTRFARFVLARYDFQTGYKLDPPLTVLEGADIIVKAAMLPDDGSSGSFFTHEMKSIPW
jgi:hypothetical protein